MEPVDVPANVLKLAARLSDFKPMRRGSVSTRFVKCSKPNCACQKDPAARHGPYYSLTRPKGGVTKSRFLSEAAAVLAKRQVEAGRTFRKTVGEILSACEEWADEELDALGKDTPAEGQKGGSRSRSKKKRPEKSND